MHHCLANSDLQLKPVRSFMHRQGNLRPQHTWALKTLFKKYVLPANQACFDLQRLFLHSAPVTLEIGFGMGQNLLAQAQKYPEQNFLGIEVYRKGIAKVLLGIESHQLHNLRIIYGDAKTIVNSCIADKSLNTIQIFFPDPWPKRRHHKRRLLQAEFAQQLQQKLTRNGQLQLATDWQDYATHMLCVLENTADLKNQFGHKQFAPRLHDRMMTKFEQRGHALGHAIWDLLFYRTE
jgi:tRNA (guanine-N7-)-methyltransferase